MTKTLSIVVVEENQTTETAYGLVQPFSQKSHSAHRMPSRPGSQRQSAVIDAFNRDRRVDFGSWHDRDVMDAPLQVQQLCLRRLDPFRSTAVLMGHDVDRAGQKAPFFTQA